MTKSELIKLLSKKHPGLQKKEVTLLVEIVLREISNSLIRGNRVELRGFGAFSIRKRKPRKARNPKTNEVVYLDERSAVYFRAGKDLRERLNKEAS